MSCVIVLAPIVVASWPVMASAVVAAATAAGLKITNAPKAKGEARERATEKVQVDLPNAEVVEESLRADDKIVATGRGVTVTFSRDARGRFKTEVEGKLPKDELRAIGEELSGKVIQQYVYRRLVAELGQSGFSTVNEELAQDEAIHLHVRRFEA